MSDEHHVPQLQGSIGLEQFVALSKTVQGADAAKLVVEATNAPGLYVYGELLEADGIKALAETEHAAYLRLLELFTYGTYSDYKNNPSSYPQLLPAQTTKLKHLSIITMASQSKTIPYSDLLTELDIANVRELEDLIIDAIYRSVIQAKLDQQNNQLEVECFIGRDIKMDQLDGMISKLEQWCSNCAAVLQVVENEMCRANDMKAEREKEKEKLENEIKTLRQVVSTATKDLDQGKEVQLDPSAMITKKGLRGSYTGNRK